MATESVAFLNVSKAAAVNTVGSAAKNSSFLGTLGPSVLNSPYWPLLPVCDPEKTVE
jgi:hypothetical protein